ncbi:unnamed protein product, partial [marine sediment metagenome]
LSLKTIIDVAKSLIVRLSPGSRFFKTLNPFNL